MRFLKGHVYTGGPGNVHRSLVDIFDTADVDIFEKRIVRAERFDFMSQMYRFDQHVSTILLNNVTMI